MEWTRVVMESFVRAPDGSEVRPLLEVNRGGMSQCTLPPGGVSQAVKHKTIEEIWYFVEGRGEVWRHHGAREEVVTAEPGVCVSIPTGAAFQFRNIGEAPLIFVIATMPPWPGMDEAVRVKDFWPV
jgi:mannose-6-phosphate isomerase-like protein (cupin superfamily)